MFPADMTKDILEVLGSPAWYGTWTAVGVTVSTTISIIALRNSRQPRTPRTLAPFLKKSQKLENIFKQKIA